MSALKNFSVTPQISNSLTIADQSTWALVYNQSSISIGSNSTTNVTVTNFFYPTSNDPLYEAGEILIFAYSATLSAIQAIKYSFTISRNGTSRSGSLSSSGWGSCKTDGSNIIAVKSSDDLVITLDLTTSATAITDGVIYVLKNSFFNTNPSTKIRVGSYTRSSVSVGPVSTSGYYGNVSAAHTSGGFAFYDFTNFFSDINIEVGEVLISARGYVGNGRKTGRFLYVNYNTNRALSDAVYSYASSQQSGGGGNAIALSTTGTTLRLNVDVTSDASSGNGNVDLGKIIYLII